LSIDTVTDEVKEFPCPVQAPGDEKEAADTWPETGTVVKWYTAVEAHGMIFCPPMGASKVLCVEIKNGAPWQTVLIGRKLKQSASAIPQLDWRENNHRHPFGWSCAARAQNGKIFCAPADKNKILKITPGEDPFTTEVEEVRGIDLGMGKHKWFDAVVTTRGSIICSPTLDRRALCITPDGDSCTARRVGSELAPLMPQGWGTGALGPDGKIYYPPRRHDKVLRFDPRTFQTELVGPQLHDGRGLKGSKWCGLVTGADGYMYGIPYDSSSVLCFAVHTIQEWRPESCASGSAEPIRKVNMPKSEVAKRLTVATCFQRFRQRHLWKMAAGFVGEGLKLFTTPGTYATEAEPVKKPKIGDQILPCVEDKLTSSSDTDDIQTVSTSDETKEGDFAESDASSEADLSTTYLGRSGSTTPHQVTENDMNSDKQWEYDSDSSDSGIHRCVLCNKEENEADILVCDTCSNRWHSYCLKLDPMPKKLRDKRALWRCMLCAPLQQERGWQPLNEGEAGWMQNKKRVKRCNLIEI
jgi:hypothetical protein